MDKEKALIKVLITIVPRGCGEEVVEILQTFNVKSSVICLGKGTAPKLWADLLCLGENKSDIVVSIISAVDSIEILATLDNKLSLQEAGKGIAFTLNINGVSSRKFLSYCLEKEIDYGV
ncbi:MAG: hypothetical protein RR033_05010 [Clostridia bacterium]